MVSWLAGAALIGAVLFMLQDAPASSGAGPPRATSGLMDALGELHVAGATAEARGDGEVRVESDRLILDGERVAALRLPDSIQLFGRVTLGGESYPGAELSFLGPRMGCLGGEVHSTVTDADGNFALALTAVTDYRVIVSFAGLAHEAGRYRFDRSQFLPLDVPGGWIEGRVRGPRGEAVTAVQVRAETVDAWRFARTLTDAEGRYALRAPAGRLTVAAGGPRRLTPQPDPAEIRGEVYVAQGVSVDLADGMRLAPVDLDLFPGAAIRGVVRDTSGTPLRSASVVVDSTTRIQRTTDERGEFELRGIAPGAVSIESWTDSGIAWATVQARAGETTQVELLAVGGTELVVWALDTNGNLVTPQSLKVWDAAGRLQPRVKGPSLWSRALMAPPAATRTGPHRPGTYLVRVGLDAGGAFTREQVVQIQGGAEQEVWVSFQE